MILQTAWKDEPLLLWQACNDEDGHVCMTGWESECQECVQKYWKELCSKQNIQKEI